MKHYNLLPPPQLYICAAGLVKYFAASAMFALIACSDDSSNNSTPSGAQNLSVATIYELGACDINAEGRMVTVNANEKIYKCSNNEWVEFSKESNETFLSSASEISELLPNEIISSSSNEAIEFLPNTEFSSSSEANLLPNTENSSSSEVASSSSKYQSSSSSKVASSSSIEVIIDDNGYFTDTRDGQKYKTVKIGAQTWMAQNLNYEVDSSFCYNNSQDSCAKYGRLYQWAAAVGKSESECGYGCSCYLDTTSYIQGVCPNGFHLPLVSEWDVLLNAVGGTDSAGTVLKSTSGWNYNGNGIDKYDFSVLPAGDRGSSGNFSEAGSYAYFWSASARNFGFAYSLVFYDVEVLANFGSGIKSVSHSVRCLKN